MAITTSDFLADIQASRGTSYIAKGFNQAEQRLRNELLYKGKGEGSRGGKIIGHTKSGKPIYEHGADHAKGFSRQDHIDAANHHDALSSGGDEHADHAYAHRGAANVEAGGRPGDGFHPDADEAKGKTIGLTQSGKEVSENGVKDAHGFTKGDHQDAIKAHKSKAAILQRHDKTEDADQHEQHAYEHGGGAGVSMPRPGDGFNPVKKNATHGEGTRGGKIIGHTKSGKPIYSSSSPMNLRGGKHIYSKVLASHSPLGYTVHDHAEAAKVHQDNYQLTGGMRHHDASIYHNGAAAAKLRGEGSTFDERHGKTSTNIGWTSSKKPIFGHDHEANTARSGVLGGHVKHKYGAVEHSEASAAHIKAAAKVGRRDGKVAARHLKLAQAHDEAAKIYDDPASPRGPSGLPKI